MRQMNDTQLKLIAATENLLRNEGIAMLTTKKIACKAGVAEGLIYYHFKDKAELIHAVIEQYTSNIWDTLNSLPLQVGLRSVETNLEDVLFVIYNVQDKIFPIMISVFADRQLLERSREILQNHERSPDKGVQIVSLYLSAEQRLGRISKDVETPAAAALILNSTFQEIMIRHLEGKDYDEKTVRKILHDNIKILMSGLSPRDKTNKEPSLKERA